MRYLTLLALLPAVLAQSTDTSSNNQDDSSRTLIQAIQDLPQFSSFRELYDANSESALRLLSNSPVRSQTVLLPNNEAFVRYKKDTGVDLVSQAEAQDTLADLFSYHVLIGKQSGEDLSGDAGATIPTLLRKEQYNNRTAGDALRNSVADAISKSADPDVVNGQVLVIKREASSSSSRMSRFMVRQAGNLAATIRSGLNSNIKMTALDIPYNRGYIHEIDAILTLPGDCNATINHEDELKSLNQALHKASLWAALNTSKNVTCLAPDDNAFGNAGDPQEKLAKDDLANALMFHTLKEPIYSSFIVDGMEIDTLAEGKTVRVSRRGNDIYFNNAKVVQADVLTNNGLVHVLNGVMKEDFNESDIPSNNSSNNNTTNNDNSAAAMSASAGALVVAIMALFI